MVLFIRHQSWPGIYYHYYCLFLFLSLYLLLLLFIIWPGKHAAVCAMCARSIIFDYLARRVLSECTRACARLLWQWVDLKAALKDFIPVVRGNTLRESPRKIDTANIYSVQVMLSKYEYDGMLASLPRSLAASHQALPTA